MYCDTQAGHVCMSLMITQQQGQFCGSSGGGGGVSPNTNTPPAPLFRLCSAAGCANPNETSRQTVSSVKKSTYMLHTVISVVDVMHTALRETWLPCELKHTLSTVSIDIIMLNTTSDCCVFQPSICLPKVTEVERAFMEKQTSLLSLMIP